MNVLSSWGRAIRRFMCCGPGETGGDPSSNEPIYERLGYQAHDAGSALEVMGEWVEEIRGLLSPIADVSERMRRLEQHLQPLLVFSPEEGEYMEMRSVPRPAPAAPLPQPPSVWMAWLQERVDYGEPW